MIHSRLTVKRNVLIFALTIFLNSGWAQEYQSPGNASEVETFNWPDKISMAVSLTFDDARYSQADSCIPLLNEYNIKGTFYVSLDNLMHRLEAWQMAVNNGHEIGNHSMKHPCSKNFRFTRERALEDYSLAQMEEELDSASLVIEKMLGIKPVSFAYPCGQTYVGEGIDTKSYVPVVAAAFQSGRTWMDEAPNDPVFCNFHQLTGIKLDGKSFEELMPLLRMAADNGMWLILAGHETKTKGDSDALVSSLETIEALCRYAKDPSNGIWIDNVNNIASYIISQREIVNH